MLVALRLEEERGHRAELLRDRRDVEDGGGRDRDAVIEVREAVPGAVDDLALEEDSDGGAGAFAAQVREDGVDAGVRGAIRAG